MEKRVGVTMTAVNHRTGYVLYGGSRWGGEGGWGRVSIRTRCGGRACRRSESALATNDVSVREL